MKNDSDKKVCLKCKKEKKITDFTKVKKNKDGHHIYCKECIRGISKKYYLENKQAKIEYQKKYAKQNAVKISEYLKERRNKNYEKITNVEKKYAQNHRKERAEQSRIYNLKNKNKINIRKKEYLKNKYNNDFNYKIKKTLRKRILNALKSSGIKKNTSTEILLGCSIEEVRKHLEKQFKPNMSWENHGRFGWHIDHIIPCAAFDLTNPKEQKKCFNYTNLQPLWANENLLKGSKF